MQDDVKSCKQEIKKLKTVASVSSTYLFDPDQYDKKA